MRRIVRNLQAVARGKLSQSAVATSVREGDALAAQLRRASRPDESAAVKLLVAKLSKFALSVKFSAKLNNGPAMWGELKKEWWKCGEAKTQAPIDIGGQKQVETRF